MDLKQQMQIAKSQLAGFDIPTIPHELILLQKCFLATEFPDFSEVAAILSQNTVLSGEVVKVANQHQFLQQGAEPVTTIKEAIDALGLKRLKNLVMALGFKAQIDGKVFGALMEHSVDVANVATELSRWVDGCDPDEVYLASLFHNAGAIIMAMKFDDYEPIFFNSLTNAYSGSKKEIEKYKVSHGVFGLLVAQKWQLDKTYAQVMLVHHQRNLSKITNEKVKSMVSLIQLASAIVSECSFDAYMGSEVKEMENYARQELLLSPEVVNEVRIALLSNSLV